LAQVLIYAILALGLNVLVGYAGLFSIEACAGAILTTMATAQIAVVRGALLATLATNSPLHGLTFALFHLAAIRLIVTVAPVRLAATAQAICGTLCVGLSIAVVTLVSSLLYARVGDAAFLIMAALCLSAAAGMRRPTCVPRGRASLLSSAISGALSRRFCPPCLTQAR
jgi:MFS transporter, PPP family, 3-phenylpropionic acid transporter